MLYPAYDTDTERICFTAIVYAYLVIQHYQADIIRLFKDYLDIISFASLVGLVQFISLVVGFRPGADYSYLGFEMQNFAMGFYRIQSWFQEPSFMAYAFAPAVFASVCRIMSSSGLITINRSVLILLAVILTQSTVAYLVLFLSVVYVLIYKYSFIRYPVAYISLVFLLTAGAIGAYHVPDIKLRVTDTYHLFFTKDIRSRDIETTNISTYALYSNYKVSTVAFINHPLIGTGLGTYETNYNKHINNVIPPNDLREKYALNKKEGNSLFFRLMVETGLVGLLALVWFMMKYRIRMRDVLSGNRDWNLWIVSNSIQVLLLARLLRLGHYTLLGFILFMILYYYAGSNNTRDRRLKVYAAS